ncbi:MAG: DNA polymerase III subunit delta [Alphaproteobacteria bacterium]
MKVAVGRIDAFLRAPDSAARAILVYGPDTGLVRERADILARTVVADIADPFLVAELSPSQLRDIPTLIADEAAAIALTGGRRVVRIREGTDAIAVPLEQFLEDSPGDALVIVQAGDINPRAALRKIFEAAPNAAAIPCYVDDERALERVIRDTLAAEKIRVTPDAMAYLCANLGADRGLSRSELEKLALYAGPGTEVTLADAAAAVGNSSALSLDNVVMAAAGGDAMAADRALTRSYQEGVNPVTVLRALARHLIRLQLARAHIDSGAAPDVAVKAIRPPIFFKAVPSFLSQLRGWNMGRLAQALSLVLEAEQQCKRTGAPAESLCSRVTLQISRLGAPRARG